MTKKTYAMLAVGLVAAVLLFMGEGGPVDQLSNSVEQSSETRSTADEEAEAPPTAAAAAPAPQNASASASNGSWGSYTPARPKRRSSSSSSTPRSAQRESRNHRLRSGETGALSLERQNIEE